MSDPHKRDDSLASLDDLITPPTQDPSRAFGEGVLIPWIGATVLRRRPVLWSYAILPILLNVLITLAVLVALVVVAGWSLTLLHGSMLGNWEGRWGWLALAGEIAAGIFLLILCFTVSLFSWRLMTGVLCGYFNGILAEKVEQQIGISKEELSPITFLGELVDTVIDLTFLSAVFVVSFALCMVPLVGGPAAALFSLYWQCLVSGVESLSYPLAMRGKRRDERYAFANKHRFHVLGLGLSSVALAFIPVVGAILNVTAVAGAVVLHRRIQLLAEESDGATIDAAERVAPQES